LALAIALDYAFTAIRALTAFLLAIPPVRSAMWFEVLPELQKKFVVLRAENFLVI
jgi:hypothetical protein